MPFCCQFNIFCHCIRRFNKVISIIPSFKRIMRTARSRQGDSCIFTDCVYTIRCCTIVIFQCDGVLRFIWSRVYLGYFITGLSCFQGIFQTCIVAERSFCIGITFQLGFYFICQIVFIDRLSKVTAGNLNPILCRFFSRF